MRYFQLSEFDCSETGKNEMDERFLDRLDKLRGLCNFPFYISSGYRDPSHSVEAAKDTPGVHSKGIAADIKVSSGARRYKLIDAALTHGFTGIGIAKTFIHVDTRDTPPVIWSY